MNKSMKNRKVVKVGGSNLKEIEDIRKISKIICEYEPSPIVVVSAFYGVTDKIVSCIDKMFQHHAKINELVNYLYELKLKYILELISDEQIRKIVFDNVKNRLDDLSVYLINLLDKGNFKPFDKDYILSYGERLSAEVIWGTVKSYKHKCEIVLPENLGLITDGIFGNSSVNLKLTKNNLENRFNSDSIYIIPGFYGVSPYGKINLLGRGGTDYSAAAIAYSINASTLDIWKDVDGFMTGDPKHVSKPSQVSHLSYLEAAELSYFGAGILHPRTVEPLQLINIPIRIFNVHKDNALSEPQTIIDQNISIYPKVIKSLTFENKTGILTVKGPGMGFIPGILSEITRILYKNAVNINSVITSQISINLLIEIDEIVKARSLVESLEIHAVTDISINTEISLVAVVGNGMTQIPGVAAKVFSAIADEGINILLSSLGASDVVTYFVIDKQNTKRAINKLHEALFKENAVESRAIA
jgi:aspartate kinase/aspartokinase/homoserine dehydrogenase 1